MTDRETTDSVELDGGTETLGEVDEKADRLLSEVTEARSRGVVYAGLRSLGEATPDEIAEETGLYPDKVERVLGSLQRDEIVEERGSETYVAVPPSELVGKLTGKVGGLLDDLLEPELDDDI